MNQQSYKQSLVVGAVAIGTIAGVAIGFFTAHRVMGDMNQMDMKGMPMEGTMPMKDMEPMGEAGRLGARKAGG